MSCGGVYGSQERVPNEYLDIPLRVIQAVEESQHCTGVRWFDGLTRSGWRRCWWAGFKHWSPDSRNDASVTATPLGIDHRAATTLYQGLWFDGLTMSGGEDERGEDQPAGKGRVAGTENTNVPHEDLAD